MLIFHNKLRVALILVGIASGMCFAEHANTGSQNPVISVRYCDVLSSPDTYDGKLISTKTTLVPTPHGNSALDPACPGRPERSLSAELRFGQLVSSDNRRMRCLSKLLQTHKCALVTFKGYFKGSSTAYVSTETRFAFDVATLRSVSGVACPKW
jgi:hypothetical protein